MTHHQWFDLYGLIAALISAFNAGYELSDDKAESDNVIGHLVVTGISFLLGPISVAFWIGVIVRDIFKKIKK